MKFATFLICVATCDASARMSGVGVGFGFAPAGFFGRGFWGCFCCAKEDACDAAPSAIEMIAIKIEMRFKRLLQSVIKQPLPARSTEFGLDWLIRE